MVFLEKTLELLPKQDESSEKLLFFCLKLRETEQIAKWNEKNEVRYGKKELKGAS